MSESKRIHMTTKRRRFTALEVFQILDRVFNKGEKWKDVARDFLKPGEDDTVFSRICLPRGHIHGRYVQERERFFRGEVPLTQRKEE